MGGRMVRKFEELTAPHGGICCQDIARVNWRDPSAVNEYYSSPDSRRKICAQVVGDVAEALGDLVDREAPGQADPRAHRGEESASDLGLLNQ
jgi:hypothetical protein